MAFSNLCLQTAMLINQFAYPIALENIKWRLYIVFAVWCPIQAAVCWWIMYVKTPDYRADANMMRQS